MSFSGLLSKAVELEAADPLQETPRPSRGRLVPGQPHFPFRVTVSAYFKTKQQTETPGVYLASFHKAS